MSSSSGLVGTPAASTSGATASLQSGILIPISDRTFNLNEEQLTKAISQVTDDTIKKFQDAIDTTTSEEISKISFVDLAYQGFDPLSIRAALLATSIQYGEDVNALVGDIMWMIAVNIYMGNIQAKSLSRRNMKGRTIVNALIKKYGIKIGTTNAGLTGTTITFPRVSASFPVLAARMASILPVAVYPRAPFQTVRIPKSLTMNGSSSFFDDSLAARTRTMLLQVICAYSCDRSITISQGEARKNKRSGKDSVMDTMEAYTTQWTFVEAASNSNVPRPNMRKAMVVEFAYASQYEVISEIATRFRTLLGEPGAVPSKQEFEADLNSYCTA